MNEAWLEAVKLFNEAKYWECHEALEPLWLGSEGLEKEFYAGIILLAAALHKARVMKSPRGGRRNFAKALAHLALLPDSYHAVDVRKLEAEVHAALTDKRLKPVIPLEAFYE